MAEAPSFFASVYALVAQIPPGFVASYGQLARMLGAPLAARQVGWAMRRCPDELPWQRVIREDGTIAGGEYAPLRRAMLEAEGVPFTQDGRVAIANALNIGTDELLQDDLNTATMLHATEISERLKMLSPEGQRKVMNVLDALIAELK